LTLAALLSWIAVGWPPGAGESHGSANYQFGLLILNADLVLRDYLAHERRGNGKAHPLICELVRIRKVVADSSPAPARASKPGVIVPWAQ